MPGVHQAHAHTQYGFETLTVPHRAEQWNGCQSILHAIERRHGRQALFAALFIHVLHIPFVNMCRVFEHNICQIRAGVSGIDWTVEALLDEVGQVAAVVNMRMGEHHSIDAGWVKGEVLVDGVSLLALTLKKAAIQQELMPVHFQQMHRSGHRTGGAQNM